MVVIEPAAPDSRPKLTVERVQTGVRIEKNLLKILKALAEYNDRTLGELLEDIVLHAFHGACACGPRDLPFAAQLMKLYELDYDAHAAYRFVERPPRAQ